MKRRRAVLTGTDIMAAWNDHDKATEEVYEKIRQNFMEDVAAALERFWFYNVKTKPKRKGGRRG